MLHILELFNKSTHVPDDITEGKLTKDNEYQIKTKNGMRIAIPKGKDMDEIKSVIADTDHVLEPYDSKYFKLANDVENILSTIKGRKGK